MGVERDSPIPGLGATGRSVVGICSLPHLGALSGVDRGLSEPGMSLRVALVDDKNENVF
jgi:hypothetical protein